MRVAIVAESFLPQINGVTNSILRMLDHLVDHGHTAIVLAPDDVDVPQNYRGVEVKAFPSISLPLYPAIRIVTSPTNQIQHTLADFAPDVVHLASPFILGYKAALASADLQIPIVAIYQTEVPAFAQRYGFPPAENALWYRVRQIHNLAYATYAPSTPAKNDLLNQGIARVGIWGRGVNSTLFHPEKRDPNLHKVWAPNGEVVIGYMGRLAKEKQIENLASLSDLPNSKIVLIGEGPSRLALERILPNGLFLGLKRGDELARCLATLDIFVHTGEYETFGQSIQEAQACGLPVVAPAKGGPIDLVTPGVNGFLYQAGDLEELRNCVEHLALNPEKRAQFGQTARAGVKDNTWENICAQMVDHYKEAIEVTRRDLTGLTYSTPS